MLVVIRADASQMIGSGHVMRCLTLAERLKVKGAKVSFICRDFHGNLSEDIKSKGFEVHLLPRIGDSKGEFNGPEKTWLGTNSKTDAEETVQVLKSYNAKIDWLIMDNYGIDYKWESYLRNWTRKIMVIDDLANRKHDCDVLLDQNYYCNLTERYIGLVPKECTLFLGPRFLLLREEFYSARREMKVRNGEISNILIFYGGADETNETEKCLIALKAYISSKLAINVVVGRSNPNTNRIKDMCSSMPNVHYYCQISNMAELINKADLAFGAGGSTMWERCLLGLPSVVTVVAENQMETTQAVSDLGAVWSLGWYEEVNVATLVKVAERLFMEPNILVGMQKRVLDVVGVRRSSGIKQVDEVIFQE